MRTGRRVARFLFWGLVLCISSLAGGLWFAYSYLTDSETIARIIREHAVRYFPKAILEPGRVRPQLTAGELALHDLKLKQSIDGTLFETLRIAFLQIKVNPRKLVEGQFEPRKIVVGQPTLRLCGRKDGTWNLQGLIADPWPGPWIETPPIVIRNGTLELYPCEQFEPDFRFRASVVAARRHTKPPPVKPNRASALARRRRATIPSTRAGRSVVDRSPAILRDVSLEIEPVGEREGILKFDGKARGDGFEQLKLTGTIDLKSGRIEFGGELSGLLLSESLRRKVPPERGRVVEALGLNAGVLDLKVNRLEYDPAKPPGNRLSYNVGARLRDGVWNCPDLPFQVNDLSADVNVEDNVLTIKHAQGSNGMTSLRADGVIAIDEFKQGPMHLHVTLDDLELDDRLRVRTPAEYKELWDVFKPEGQSRRHVRRGPLEDRGTARLESDGLLSRCRGGLSAVSLSSRPSDRPVDLREQYAHRRPEILERPADDDLRDDPEPGRRRRRPARDQGRFAADRRCAQEGHASRRAQDRESVQPRRAGQGPRQGVAQADERRDGPTGRADPDRRRDRIERALRDHLGRSALPDPQLEGADWKSIPTNGHSRTYAGATARRRSSPAGVSKSSVAYPSGSTATIRSRSTSICTPRTCRSRASFRRHCRKRGRRPGRRSIRRAPATSTPRCMSLRLPRNGPRSSSRRAPRRICVCSITRSPQPGIDPGGTFELPMDDVHGRFVFDNGVVTMNDVNFKFRGGAVRFSTGTAFLEDNGRFDLNVHELWVEDIRFDLDLRKKMPPLDGAVRSATR